MSRAPEPADGESPLSSAAPAKRVEGKTGPTDDPGPPVLYPDDFYMEGPFLVFTAAYHLRRGFCCHSDCRHCPYK